MQEQSRREFIGSVPIWVLILTGNGAAKKRNDHQQQETAMDNEADIVWNTVQVLNRAWVEDGDAGKLREYFHRDIVAITPVDRERLEGCEACVAGWAEFVKASKINRWHVSDPDVRLYGGGHFAIVTYYYDMSYDTGGKTVETAGRDMFAIVKENGRWWAVANQFSPYPG